jgi:hypothetical protein
MENDFFLYERKIVAISRNSDYIISEGPPGRLPVPKGGDGKIAPYSREDLYEKPNGDHSGGYINFFP